QKTELVPLTAPAAPSRQSASRQFPPGHVEPQARPPPPGPLDRPPHPARVPAGRHGFHGEPRALDGRAQGFGGEVEQVPREAGRATSPAARPERPSTTVVVTQC